MTTKNLIKYLVFALVVAMAGVSVYLLAKDREKSVNSLKEDVQDTNREIVIQNKNITDKTPPFDIQIDYPYVENQDDFNARAEKIANEELKQFKENSLANDQAVKVGGYYLKISYDKGELNSKIVSIVFNISNFEGGAHGAQYFSALNYNLEQNKEIVLSDLFPGQADYLQKISDYCIKDLESQIKDRVGEEGMQTAWIGEGAGVKLENYQNFLIFEDKIIFYFPQYQVAAYAIGDFKVQMPR